jgi:hypothetical protein
MRMPMGFAVTHFGHSKISAHTSSYQLRSNRTQAAWRDDGFDLFHLSTLAWDLGPTLAIDWRVHTANCTGGLNDGACLACAHSVGMSFCPSAGLRRDTHWTKHG